jgi:small-conductance mechanosensitive channel
MRVVERSVSWVAWLGMVLWVTGLLPLILQELDAISWKIGSTTVSVRNLIEGAVTAVLVLMLVLWLSAALEARLLKGATDNLSIRKMAANALRALLLLIGLMFALSGAGIDLTALGVLGGALGVGIGPGPAEAGGQLRERLSSSWPNAACASATWSRSTASRAASPTSPRATP